MNRRIGIDCIVGSQVELECEVVLGCWSEWTY